MMILMTIIFVVNHVEEEEDYDEDEDVVDLLATVSNAYMHICSMQYL